MRTKAAAGVVLGVAAALVVLALDLGLARVSGPAGLQPLDAIELKTYDWRLAWTARPETARPDLALVEIDEYSLRNLQPNAGRWPWPRAVHSMLLDYLARAPARVVAYDVDFAEPDTRQGFAFGGATWSGAESDRALVESVKASGNVILLADATYEGESVGAPPAFPDAGFRLASPLVAARSIVFPPFAALAGAAAGFGHNLFVLDADGPMRHAVPFVRVGDGAMASLGVAAALRAAGIRPDAVGTDAEHGFVLGGRVMPASLHRATGADGARDSLWTLIDFRGPALLADLKSRPYAHYSFFDLLYSEGQIMAGVRPKIDPSAFKDKIIFVGVTASGLHDVFETPFSRGKMPGVQVHAAVADDVLSNRFLAPTGARARVAAVLVSAVAVGVAAALLPAWWAAGVGMGWTAGLVWVATRAFAGGAWLNLTLPVLASTVALFGGVSYQYVVEGREKRKMKRLFGQYVSKDVYDQLVAHPEFARLGGQRREMSVLFSDIRGFTTLTERGRPEDVVAMLNEYFTRMVAVVFKHQGTLDKFVGDMVMALFGAPLDDPRHAEHAVAAAIEMCAELQALNARWAAQGRTTGLDIGVGVNTGAMIAGNIGSDAIMSYTVIGDAVNLGARLESLNKQYGTRIIISDATRRQLPGGYEVRPLGTVVVKGKTAPVEIFEVVSPSGGLAHMDATVAPAHEEVRG
ncbi:MAG: adenylate/guanylate cyclase domain-containing protein [Acidobacteriota bacterium]